MFLFLLHLLLHSSSAVGSFYTVSYHWMLSTQNRSLGSQDEYQQPDEQSSKVMNDLVGGDIVPSPGERKYGTPRPWDHNTVPYTINWQGVEEGYRSTILIILIIIIIVLFIMIFIVLMLELSRRRVTGRGSS